MQPTSTAVTVENQPVTVGDDVFSIFRLGTDPWLEPMKVTAVHGDTVEAGGRFYHCTDVLVASDWPHGIQWQVPMVEATQAEAIIEQMPMAAALAAPKEPLRHSLVDVLVDDDIEIIR